MAAKTVSDRSDSGSVADSDGLPSDITDFHGEHDFLSNFYWFTIDYDGIEYPTVEHAFQGAKCLDEVSKKKIAGLKSPASAKWHGRRVQLRPDWESVKLDIMHQILSLKFAEGSELAEKLLATGQAQLIEGNKWHDNFWGSCECARHHTKPGANHLGKLLMEVRKELRSLQEDDVTVTSRVTSFLKKL